ncbi:GntP family permease [Zhouia sp. PK063]|uniref:GntP family permease n=1 Tax=Zhouia sp. PK063 TaxID=3373602 RepID=UPI00378DAA18
MNYQLLIAVTTGIIVLLILILKLKQQAFLALLISSILVGLIAGLPPEKIIDTIKQGMGGTLGSVATIVGLGAIFGAILEKSGSANVIAIFLTQKFGIKNAPSAMAVAGFLIAIPVFFDVAFIILIPVIYSLQRKTKKSLLLYAIPLLSGLAITHAFIPPTPGPVAVADIIKVNLGWVILVGFLTGIPTALVSGLWFGTYISKKINVSAPEILEEESDYKQSLPSIFSVLTILGLPIFLILLNTALESGLFHIENRSIVNSITFIGHPFSALIIANVIAWYVLGTKRGYTKNELLNASTKSLKATGVIILLTGAGGVFKQMLVDTKAGELIATSLTSIGLPVLIFAFIAAALIRILQGSSTIAMITAAGLVAPILAQQQFSNFQLACVVTAIASGASILSHVNDSGFWLVSQYLGLTEKQTFKSWTVMTTILAFTGLITVSILFTIF